MFGDVLLKKGYLDSDTLQAILDCDSYRLYNEGSSIRDYYTDILRAITATGK